MNLSERHCVPCAGGEACLDADGRRTLLGALGRFWRIVDDHHLAKEFEFLDFEQALAFTVRVGGLAEREGHHPQILLAWGMVTVSIWTMKVDCLTESDFVLAAKIEEVY